MNDRPNWYWLPVAGSVTQNLKMKNHLWHLTNIDEEKVACRNVKFKSILPDYSFNVDEDKGEKCPACLKSKRARVL